MVPGVAVGVAIYHPKLGKIFKQSINVSLSMSPPTSCKGELQIDNAVQICDALQQSAFRFRCESEHTRLFGAANRFKSLARHREAAFATLGDCRLEYRLHIASNILRTAERISYFFR